MIITDWYETEKPNVYTLLAIAGLFKKVGELKILNNDADTTESGKKSKTSEVLEVQRHDSTEIELEIQ